MSTPERVTICLSTAVSVPAFGCVLYQKQMGNYMQRLSRRRIIRLQAWVLTFFLIGQVGYFIPMALYGVVNVVVIIKLAWRAWINSVCFNLFVAWADWLQQDCYYTVTPWNGARLGVQWCNRRKWHQYVVKAKIRWVKASAFRRWSSLKGCKMPRMQKLQPDEFVVADSDEDWFKTGQPMRIIVSHPWLQPGHPDDKDGTLLKTVVAELNRLKVDNNALIFFDYCSIPQNGRHRNRSSSEEADFKAALAEMDLLYTLGLGNVLILPYVPKHAVNNKAYFDRGWCFFELGVSADYGRIINYDNPDVVALIEKAKLPMRTRDFKEQLRAKHFTARASDLETVANLHGKVTGRQFRETIMTNFALASPSLCILAIQVLIAVTLSPEGAAKYGEAIWNVFNVMQSVIVACLSSWAGVATQPRVFFEV